MGRVAAGKAEGLRACMRVLTAMVGTLAKGAMGSAGRIGQKQYGNGKRTGGRLCVNRRKIVASGNANEWRRHVSRGRKRRSHVASGRRSATKRIVRRVRNGRRIVASASSAETSRSCFNEFQ